MTGASTPRPARACKALAARLKALGEQHPSTASSYSNLASCLHSQGKHAEALPLYHKALAIRLKVLGKLHPDTAQSYNNLAFWLNGQGKHAEALPLYHKALALRRKILGEQYPDTASSYSNLASCLNSQGKYAEAASTRRRHCWAMSGRLQASTSSFDRSLFHANYVSPRSALAACLVRQGKPRRHGSTPRPTPRGLLDALLSAENTPTPNGASGQQARPDPAASAHPRKARCGASQRRDALAKERDVLLAELAAHAAQRTRDRVLSLPRIQKQLPRHAALSSGSTSAWISGLHPASAGAACLGQAARLRPGERLGQGRRYVARSCPRHPR